MTRHIGRSPAWALLMLLMALLPVEAADTGPSAPSPSPASDKSVPAGDTPVDETPVNEQFIAAMQRIRLHQPEPADSPALEAYVIHDYLVAARLRRDLSLSAADELDAPIDAFLNAHAGQPVTRALRHDWLASLATRGRWDVFLSHASDLTDPLLLCDRLAGRLATHDTAGLAAEALARWNVPQIQPDACAPAFEWLRTQGVLTPELAESRTRAALAADNVRAAHAFVNDVPAPRAAPLLLWLQLLDAPKAALTGLAGTPSVPVETDALLAGFTRLSFSDTNSATALLPQLLERTELTPETRVRLQRSAALGAAYSRAPGAVAAFEKLPEDPADTQTLEWRVRAALWAGEFAKAAAWIDKMPATMAAQPRWRYWHARSLGATAGAAAAAPLYAEIAGVRDYYGYLAADRLKQTYNLNNHPSPDDPEVQTILASDPGLLRAHALFDSEMTDDANAEWAAVVAAAKPAVKVQAAHLASRWGWYAQTIAMLAQAGEWDDVVLRYPRPYAGIVAEASKETQVPADWLFGIMRQESLFRRDAVSRADARGLMQMLPATAVTIAHRWNLQVPTRDSLFDPQIAVKFGAIYVHELLDRYKGQLDQSLAAYNAGPVSVARWMPATAMDADVWIENIPYTETRGYVQHILEHIVAFATVRNAEPTRLSLLLPQLEPQQPNQSH